MTEGVSYLMMAGEVPCILQKRSSMYFAECLLQ